MVGAPPFEHAKNNDMFWKLLSKKEYDKFWEIFGDFSEEFKDLIQGMLHENPAYRMQLRHVKEHVWLKGSVATQDEIKYDLLDTESSEADDQNTRE